MVPVTALPSDADQQIESDPDVAVRSMRADARRNRALVLAAAEAAFAEAGLKAQVEEIARRAGVGVGTVCRHFPTKQALLEAVLEAMYTSLLVEAEAALTEPDAGAAFDAFFHQLADFQARHRALAESMATTIDVSESAQPTKQALRRALTQLVKNAQAAGAIRDDIGAADVTTLFSGVAHTTGLAGDLQPVLRQRYVAIILDGLRPHDRGPLPGKPMSFAQLDRIRNRPSQ
jgi:AcrR family transcriptional regulator